MILGYLTSEVHGVWTLNHLLATLLCLSVVFLLIVFTRKKDEKFMDKLFLIISILLLVGEGIKQGFNNLLFHEEYSAILPLFYCSLLLYLVIPLFFVKGKTKDTIYGIIMYFGLVPSLVYICYPITAINNHPFLSYPALHGMFYHSMMLYMSLIIAIKKLHIVNKKDIIPFAIITVSYSIVVEIVNLIFKTNFMFITYPVGGSELLEKIYNIVTPPIYCIATILGQTLGSYLVSYYSYKLIQNKTNH